MIIQNITLDLSQKSPCQYVYSKQGDDQSRHVCVHLTHEGKPFSLPGITANLRARKPDGTMVLDPAIVNEDGTVTVELTQQLLAVSGPVLADICLCGSKGEILSTVSFVIHVDTAPSGERMDSTSEFLTLMDLVRRVEGTLTTDKTLSIQDRAADSKAVGDGLAQQWGRVDALAGNLGVVADGLDVERKRISQLSSLKAGSTTGDAELQDIRVGWDGAVHQAAGDAVRAVGALAGDLPQFRYLVDSAPYSRLTSRLTEDGFYSITASLWDDLPCGHCTILVFRYATNYVLQIAVAQADGAIFSRVINRNDCTPYIDWSDTLSHNGYKLPVTTPVVDPAAFDRLTAKLTTPGYYNIVASSWDDLPFGHCSLFVFQHSANYVTQIAVSTVDGNVWTRIVHRSTFAVYRDWAASGGAQPVKILCVGDSIAYGARNGRKGFVGDLGMPYKIVGVTGATLSNKRAANATTIPDQLVNVTDYEPDVIIANGGVNDFYYNASLGVIPGAVVTGNGEAEALDRDTVMGGLQYLFYKMVTLYPKAQRFFLLTHKTKANLNGVFCDWTITANTTGYTQTELFDAIKQVCALYGVKVIDVFGESMIHTAFDAYRSSVAYTEDGTVTNREFVDADGIHPLAYGYLHGYVPLVKQALEIGTRK